MVSMGQLPAFLPMDFVPDATYEECLIETLVNEGTHVKVSVICSWISLHLVLSVKVELTKFLFVDFIINLLDFVDSLIDVHGLGDFRFGFGPVPVPAGSSSVRFRFSRFIFFARFGRFGSKTVRFPVLGSVRGLPANLERTWYRI